jgi:peptidoglycan hydrolase-like protein with peptidoglycan-binding domain
MTAAKKPAGPLFTTKTKLPGGWKKIIQVAEDLRSVNTDGYMPGSLLLSKIKGWPYANTPGVVCSPFTANVIGAALDPSYVAGRGQGNADAYEPQFDGGKPLPFMDFYHLHNGNYPIPSIVNYGLGVEISPTAMRRGDYLAIDWAPKGGHSVFCWDVHVNKDGKVDAFQMLGSNGTITPPSGWGVTIGGCGGKPWIEGDYAGYTGKGKGTLKKVGGPVFVDTPATLKRGTWYALKGVTKDKVDPGFLKAVGANLKFGRLNQLKCAHFFQDSDDDPKLAPEPYCQLDGSPRATDGSAPVPSTPVSAGPPGHAEVTSTPVKAADVKGGPAAIKTVPPLPAAQDPGKPLPSQLEVEAALKEFHLAGWIANDPGDSTNLNDSQSQAALKEFQAKFGLDADGIAGPKTKAMIRLQLPAVGGQLAAMAVLSLLKAAGLIESPPGPSALTEFQGQAGLPKTGVADVATQAKLAEKAATTGPTSDKQGVTPTLIAVYWMGNTVKPGGTATLRVASMDLRIGQELQLFLKDVITKKEVSASVKVLISGEVTEVKVPMPADFASGCIVFARVAGTLDGGKAVELPAPAPLYIRAAGDTSEGLELFFNYKGWIGPVFGKGEREKNKAYTYAGYRVPGKTSWFVRGRGNVDVDGAPNAYHPDPKMDKNFVHAGELATHDVMSLARPLDCLADGPSGLQKKDGKLYVQGPNDPAPGYLVMATTLRRKKYETWDAREWADARVTPFFAIQTQILFQKHEASSLPYFGGYEGVGAGHTGNYGDYVTAINLNPHKYRSEKSFPPEGVEMIELNGKQYPIAHGLIGDAGNQPHIGECSYAFAKALHTLDGPEWADVLWMVHPGTGKGPHVIPEPADIKSEGQRIFDAWGGKDQMAKVLSRPEMKSNGK